MGYIRATNKGAPMINGLGNDATLSALEAKSPISVQRSVGFNEVVLRHLEAISGHTRPRGGWNNDVAYLLGKAANVPSTKDSWNQRVQADWDSVIEGFSPLDISGMVGFYDVDATEYRTVSSGKLTALRDRSGNENNLSQGMASLQPLMGLQLNGRDVLDWDMGEIEGIFPAMTAGTAILVVKHDSDGDNTKGLFTVTDDPGSLANGWSGWLTSTEAKSRVVTNEGGNQNTTSANTDLLGSWGIYTSRFSLASVGMSVRVNGSAAGSNAAVVGETMAQVTDTIVLGNIGGGVLYHSEGQLAMGLFWNTRLSDADTALVEAWVSARYGL